MCDLLVYLLLQVKCKKTTLLDFLKINDKNLHFLVIDFQ